MHTRILAAAVVCGCTLSVIVHLRRRRALQLRRERLTGKHRAFAAVLLLKAEQDACSRDHDAIATVVDALQEAGAAQVVAVRQSALVVVATFVCLPAGRQFKKHSPGQETLHRCYYACPAIQSAALVPPGEDVLVRDYASVLPRVSSGVVPSRPELSAVVSVVVTTSPMRCDPELEMLEAVFDSLRLAGLGGCRTILICDHKEERPPVPPRAGPEGGGPGGGSITLKRETLPRPFMERYRERMARLREAAWAADVEIVELDRWHGFALGVRRALDDLVCTPLVLVNQHDTAFLRNIDLRPVAEQLLRAPAASAGERVNYVAFPRATQHGYRRELLLRTGLRVGGPVTFGGEAGEVALTRFPQILDGTHMARCDWYRHIFRRAEREETFRRLVSLGKSRFSQEMTLGPYMLALAKAAPPRRVAVGGGGAGDDEADQVSLGVLRVVAEFGTWLWNTDDPQGFVVFHLDASRHHARWECEATGLPPSEMISNYRTARERQAMGLPVDAILPLVPRTTGKRVLAESGLCQELPRTLSEGPPGSRVPTARHATSARGARRGLSRDRDCSYLPLNDCGL